MSRVTPVHAGRMWKGLQALILSLPGILILSVPAGATNSAAASPGERIYREGILPSSKPLKGDRAANGFVEGQAAACVNCHRPSGFGTIEGSIVISPIIAKYLYQPRGRQTAEEHTGHSGAVVRERSAYTDASLAKAISQGIDPDGRTLDYLMPRYKLDDDVMASLIAYVKGLSSGRVPGVTSDTLHFATIVTPDSDPVNRKAMLDILEHFFAAKDTLYEVRTPLPQSAQRPHARVARKWQLHVWELTGDPATWKAQLHARLAREPVFAIISGIGGKTWEPVHSFCQEESIPCLLPNVELPVVKESDFFNVYFSRGVLLEADLIAQWLRKQMVNSPRGQITQVYRTDDIGAEAAYELCQEAEPIGFRTANHALKPGDSLQGLAELLKNAAPQDAVVLWLRPEDLKALPADAATRSQLYVSGLMSGLENTPLSGSLRNAAHVTYPFELPARRVALLNYPLGWFRSQHIPVVAEETQVDTYIACMILSENLNSMSDDLVRDYLLERIEVMLGDRIVDGYYPRLGLAPGQRFASKGGYIVRLTESGRTKVTAESDWIVP